MPKSTVALVLFVLAFAIPVSAQNPPIVQVAGAAQTGTSVSIPITATGNGHVFMVPVCGSWGPAITAPTDNAPGGSSTYTLISASTQHGNGAANQYVCEYFMANPGKPGATLLTDTTPSTQETVLWFYELSGLAANPVDQAGGAASGAGTFSSFSGPFLNASQANELILDVGVINGTLAGVNNPWTQDVKVTSGGEYDAIHLIAPAPGTYSPTWTNHSGFNLYSWTSGVSLRLASPVASAIVQRSGWNPSCGASASCVTNIAPTRAGDLLVVFADLTGSTGTISVSDNKGQHYAQVAAPLQQAAANNSASAWYFPNSAAGVTNVTVSRGAGVGISADVVEVTGAATVNPLDAQAGAISSFAGTVYNSGSITTSNATDILFGFSTNDTRTNSSTIPTAGTGYTSLDEYGLDSTEYQVVNVASTYSAAFVSNPGSATCYACGGGTGSLSSDWTSQIIAFRLGSGSSGAALASLAVTPASATVPSGGTQQLVATGSYSDGSTKDLSASVNWTSSNTSAATVSNSGLATGVATGSATITATLNSLASSANLSIVGGNGQIVSAPQFASPIVQVVAGTGVYASQTIQVAATGTGNVFIVPVCGQISQGGHAPIDNAPGGSSTYTQISGTYQTGPAGSIGANYSCQYYIANPGKAGVTQVTLNSNASNEAQLWFYELTGLAPNPVDRTGGTSGITSSTNLFGPALNAASPNELLLETAYLFDGLYGVTPVWTQDVDVTEGGNVDTAHLITSTTGAYSANFIVPADSRLYWTTGVGLKLAAAVPSPIVQRSGWNTSCAFSSSCTTRINSTQAGDLVVVFVSLTGSTASATGGVSVRDSGNQGYSEAGAPLYQRASRANNTAEVWYFPNTTGGVINVTASRGSGTGIIMDVVEVSGVTTTNPFDGQTGTVSSAPGNTFNSGNLTTSNANDIILGFETNDYLSTIQFGGGGPATHGAGFTALDEYAGTGSAYRVVGSSGSYNSTYTSDLNSQTCYLCGGGIGQQSVDWTSQVVAFKLK